MRINDSIFLGAIVPELDNGALVIQQNKRILFLSLLSRSIEVVVRGVPPLALPDAIAKSLEYLKVFGGTEQRNLPDGYIQRQFIYMMDGSYLLTDIVPTYDGHIEMDFATTTMPSSGYTIMGGRIDNYPSGLNFGVNASTKIAVFDGFAPSGATGRYTSDYAMVDNTRYKYVWNNQNVKLITGGTVVAENTFAYTTATGGALAINALNNNGTITGNVAGIYLYSFKAWNAQGELVANYVPAVQKGTVPVVGFYDTVSGTFKTATSGTFAAGGEAVPTPDTPMDIISNNGVLKARHQSGLPLGYTALEYIQSSGSQYIDTGRVPNNNDIIEQKFQKVGTSTTTCSWYGSIPSSQTIIPRIGIGSFLTGGTVRIFTGSNYTATIGGVITNVHTLRFQATGQRELTYTFNGVTEVIEASEGTNMYEPAIELTSYLFARHGDAGVQVYDNEGTRIYYHREYLANGTLVLNFIPARRNSDNVLGMYDTVSGTFFTNAGTGEFIAGADAVPTPDTPMDIVSNNGVLKLTPNLVDTSLATKGYYIDSSGNITQSANWAVSDYIPVAAGQEITVSGLTYSSSVAKFNYYDSSKVKTETISYGNGTLTVPNNASYIRICYRWVDDEDTVCLNEGGSVRPLIADGTQETIGIRTRNLFDYANFYDNYVLPSTSSVGRIAIKLSPNTQYTVSTNTQESETAAQVWVVSGTGTGFSPQTATNGVLIDSPRTVTSDNNGYICIGLRVVDGGGSFAPLTEQDFIDGTVWVQIEQGSTATAYVPYMTGTATAEMLLKVGDYEDVQSIIDGAVTRNVGVKVLDGTENWENLSGYMNILKTNLGTNSAVLPANSTNIFCTHFQVKTDTFVDGVGSGNSYVNFKYDSVFTTLAQWKQWLADQYAAGTPVIVIYPLATPTTETVAGQALQVQAGDNYVEITQASLDNLELEAKYQAAVTLTIQEVQDANLDPNVQVTIN